MMFLRFFSICLGLFAFSIPAQIQAQTQNLFAPVVKINERAVTGFEVEQRAKFLRLLRAPGDPQAEALKVLVNERLQSFATLAAGIVVSDAQVQVGMEEFAARANLSAEDFIKALTAGGVAQETFRDFVKSGLGWRELVRAKFGPRSQISEAEIDRAIAQSGSKGGLRVLLSEIILPANSPAAKAQSEKRAAKISALTSTAAFSAHARRHSASASKARGGRLDWMPLSNLPPQIRGQILTLKVGQVSAPIPIPNAIVLFQMRAIEETQAPKATDILLEYAAYYIAGGRSQAALGKAAKIKGKIDSCDDLFGIAKSQPEDILEVLTLPISDVPKDVAIELAKLDPGEVSTNLTRADGETLVLLMLCGRTAALSEDVSREAIRQQLRSARLQSYADSYLAELKADATIVYQ